MRFNTFSSVFSLFLTRALNSRPLKKRFFGEAATSPKNSAARSEAGLQDAAGHRAVDVPGLAVVNARSRETPLDLRNRRLADPSSERRVESPSERKNASVRAIVRSMRSSSVPSVIPQIRSPNCNSLPCF